VPIHRAEGFTVAHENLGALTGLVAAASLLIDYTLTVSVSIAASVEAIISAAPGIEEWRIRWRSVSC
jgi:hypothetical protein